MTTDLLYEEFRDLLQEVPEAERALREYRALRNRQSLDAVRAHIRVREMRQHEEAWDALRDQLRARGLSISDTSH